MNQKSTMGCNVVSYGSSETGTKAYLRMVDGEEEVTLPLTKASQKHRSYILSTWVKSYAPAIRKWLGEDFTLTEEAKVAETLWEQTSIVTPSDDDFTVHAWCCGVPGRLDYVYVPPELRRKGIASALIAHVCGSDYEYGRPWPYKKGPHGGKYNPYLLGRGIPYKS